MKRNPLAILALALCSLMPANAAENTVKYTDATRLTIVNKARPDSPDFQRLDVARYPDLTPIVARYYRQPTGLAIVFRTDSRNLYARWTTTGQTPKVNSPLVSQRGLDLYIRQNGEWVYAGSGNPKIRGSEHEAPLVEHMDGTMHECLLYLPLFDEISRLEIGVDENARLEAAPNPFRHKVVVIGSSIGGMPVRRMAGTPATYIMCAFRLLILPVGVFYLATALGADRHIASINAVLIGMPVASFGTMFCMKYGRDDTAMTQGTFLSTLLSVATIPLLAAIIS